MRQTNKNDVNCLRIYSAPYTFTRINVFDMRRIVLPIIILGLFSMAAFSQAPISPVKQSLDVNGPPFGLPDFH
jgi:hypothetical protein